ncbi:hypothetical protein BD560DRAFT_409019 [Blakeslea trispora]|nr:hypothetical protein BD560DRAFT_409019 [Blakeslea trispora]
MLLGISKNIFQHISFVCDCIIKLKTYLIIPLYCKMCVFSFVFKINPKGKKETCYYQVSLLCITLLIFLLM